MFSRLMFVTLISASLLACSEKDDSKKDKSKRGVSPQAASVMPGCYTHLIVEQLHPSLGSPDFPDSIPFDLPSAQASLEQKGYQYLGEEAAQHSDNVVVQIVLSHDLSSANIHYRQWTQSADDAIFQLNGNIDLETVSGIALSASSVDEAVQQVIAQMSDCSKLQ